MIFGGVLGVSGLIAWAWFKVGLPIPGCAFKEMTGVPCPTCGTTRMLRALFAGELWEAFLWNPLLLLACVAVGLWMMVSAYLRLSGRRGLRIALERWERWTLRIAGGLAILAGWGYLILREVLGAGS
jgi:hypothetical protein